MPHVFAFMTGEKVTAESAEHGSTDSQGWIDPSWSMTTFHDSRNDVRPVVDCDLSDPNLADYVAEALAQLGAAETSDGSTFYGVNSVIWDYAESGDYRYALHFIVKDYSAEKGWHETDWSPGTSLCLLPTGNYGGVCGLAPDHDGAHHNVNDD